MIKSKFKKKTEIFMLIGFQLFLLGGAIFKIFTTNAELEYLLVISFVLLIIIVSFLMVSNLFKSVEINDDKLYIKKPFFYKLSIKKNEIEGYWYYKTIGALGEEESIYIKLRNGKKIGFHGKAYENFNKIKIGFKHLNLKNLGDYNYKSTYLKYFKIAIPLAFFLSVLLFLLTKIM